MTTWVAEPEGGRARGPRALARAWVEVLVRPRRFFRNGIAPADQAPGLVFGVLVAVVVAGGRLATGAVPDLPPFVPEAGLLRAVFLLLAVGLFLAPATFHLAAALATLGLAVVAPNRGGVSETVQLVAYATAPCVFTAIPSPTLRVVCCLYGTGLLVVGTTVRHDCSAPRAVLAMALPATLVFGVGFGGFAAAGLT